MTIKLLADIDVPRASGNGKWTIPDGRVADVFSLTTEAGLIAAKLAVASTSASDWMPPSDALKCAKCSTCNRDTPKHSPPEKLRRAFAF